MNTEERIDILTHKLFDCMMETVHLMVAIADDIGCSRWKLIVKTLWVEIKMAREAATKLLPQEIAIVDAEELKKQARELK